MKPILQYFDRLILCIIVCTLSSCFDGREEFWINSNSSGRAEITYSIPLAAIRANGGEQATRTMILESLQSIPAISSPTCELISREGRSTLIIKFSFDSALDLKNISSISAVNNLPPVASHLSGEITANIRGRSLDYS
ncbi:MAG: hypothetical protein H8M99_06160, partial [Gloeobacteraceae cyanobacterium ES-bin-144]|nr:hypothetical protein [Verrucomicrobiales bacterium]